VILLTHAEVRYIIKNMITMAVIIPITNLVLIYPTDVKYMFYLLKFS
jgi:hypothetical protein